MFFPREIQVWFDASSLALGGKLVKNMPIANLYADTDALYQFLGSLSVFDLNKTIIVFTGKWDFDGIELCGYFSVQNQEDWRKTYGDISISAYAKKEFEDLVDGSWSLENARQIVLEFVKIFARPTRTLVARPTQISFSRDVYSEVNPTNLTALYLSGERRSLLRVFYKALLASEDESIVLKSKPLDSRFLIDTLIINSIVTQRIENRLERDLVDELPAGSALYFGKERTSFEKLYHEISEAVLRPTFSKLPRNPNSGTKKLMMVLENIKMKKANHFHNISGENHLRRPVD